MALLRRRTPLAWLSLVHDRRRFLAATVGVAFAVVLMLVELGFLNAIYDSSTLVIEAFDADLVIVSRLKDDTNPSKPFPRALVASARAVPGVTSAHPLYLSRWGVWHSSGTSKQDTVRVLAFDPDHALLRLPEVNAQLPLLKRDDAALVDSRLRDSYGGLGKGTRGELRGRRMEVVGEFPLGPDLEMNATLVVSESTFRRVFQDPRTPRDPLLDVDFGLVRVDPGSELGAVRNDLEHRLGPTVDVLTPDQLIRRVHGFWTVNKPVGAVFGMGSLVGFVIGILICYQVLFTDVVDQLPEFSTLRAMGYGEGWLRGLALRRGLYLALSACALGLPLGFLAYHRLAELTGLTFRLGPPRIALVVAATLLMCLVASLLAMRRAIHADPADVF